MSRLVRLAVFVNDTATTEIYTLSLHDALPICGTTLLLPRSVPRSTAADASATTPAPADAPCRRTRSCRSEEHTSELQSRQYLVCRLLLENKIQNHHVSNPVATLLTMVSSSSHY